MSNCTLIIGESGSGKSTSLRNLNHKETFICGVLDKPLPFRGYKSNYHAITGWDDKKGNYFSTDDYARLIKCIRMVNEHRPEIQSLIIDDFQYLMCNEFMRRASERGYERFTDIAQHAWLVIQELTATREDLFCYVLSHSDADQNGRMKAKTIGKMLDDKITLEGMFTQVFHSQIIDGGYKFLTQNNGSHLAKSPLGMFSDQYIDNDLVLIQEKMKDYFNE